MKLTINGVEQKESEFKGETLEVILDMMVWVIRGVIW